MKLLGLDYGDSKVGIAIGDTESKVALPFGIVKNHGWQNLFKEIKNICQKENIEKIIVGLPINIKAHSSKQIDRVEEFVNKLKLEIKVVVETQDEQLTTRQAQKISGKNKDEDDVAAMLILQSYLDAVK